MKLRRLGALAAPLLFVACGNTGESPNSGRSPATQSTGASSGMSAAGGTSAHMATGGSDAASGGGGSPSTDDSGEGNDLGATGGALSDLPLRTEAPFLPTNISTSDARKAYDDWKAIHLEDCGGGVWRVPWENARLDSTVSEGIGYGMLLTVIFDDRAAFDGLFEYSKLMRNDNQLMHWLRYGCDAHYDTKYNDYPDNSASDADLDVAMALLMAQCKWGNDNYGAEATTVINAIKDHMFMDFDGLAVLQPGDSSWFDDMNNGCINYSYMAPAYYRAFGEHVSEDAGFWNKAADDTYTLLEMGSDPNTGLVRNWGSSDGNQATDNCHNAYHRSGSYGDDAARTPWRIVTDYLWYGTPKAKEWNDKVTSWVKTQGIQDLVQWYHLDGSPDTEADTWDDHTAINIAPFAAGAMVYDQETLDEFTAELVTIPSASGNHDAEYFPRMLKALSLVTLTDQFTRCGGN